MTDADAHAIVAVVAAPAPTIATDRSTAVAVADRFTAVVAAIDPAEYENYDKSIANRSMLLISSLLSAKRKQY